MKKAILSWVMMVIGISFLFSACAAPQGNVGQFGGFPFPEMEAEWIRDGEPIIFEGENWFPADTIDVLIDSEVYLLGEYRGVQFFIEKADVRPYDRLYTKFGRAKFRIYRKKMTNDHYQRTF